MEQVTQQQPEQEAQKEASIPTSGTFASCGRVVHVRSRFYSGPRPALVIDATYGLEKPQFVTVNVEVMGMPSGDGDPGTITIPLFDPLTDKQREYMANSAAYWAEWMPFQKGQAAKTEAAEGPVKQALKLLAAHADDETRAAIEKLLA